MAKQTALLSVVQKYFETDPVAASRSLELVHEKEAADILKSLQQPLVLSAFANFNDNTAAAVLQNLPPHLIKTVIDKMEPEQVSAIFLRLPADLRPQFLEYLDERKKRTIQDFLTYPEDSAGRIMATTFLALHGDLKIKDAVQKIRQHAQKGTSPTYAYVVDHENRLIGVLNMRDLLLSPHDSTLESVMRTGIFTVNCFDDLEKVAAELSERRLFAVPVTDHENRLLGIIKAEQLIGTAQDEATEDIQRMFGAGGDEKAFSSVGFVLQKRLPWLYVNLATAFLAAWVVSLFEDIISKITILAVYLPVVAGQGGNAGAQSLAVVMRGLVMREIRPKQASKLIWKETWIGLINGLAIGVVTALVGWLWQGNAYLGLVIGLGMIVNLTVAGLSGAAIPLFMKSIGLDPAQCSSIILTTITDVMGFFAFLGFAVIFQNFLI